MVYHIIGLMSGTSLDGLDIAYCSFTYLQGKWSYEILKSKTYNYSNEWQNKLKTIENSSALDFIKTDTELGKYFGEKVNEFIITNKINKNEIDAIASHGHTVFHQPDLGFTTQIGSGAQICAVSELKTIIDFRSLDVALKGQGAPLVPIGDLLLFNDYDYCLNIGGIANISSQENGVRIAKDITFANMIGNHLCESLNIPFDDKGKKAREGKLNLELLAFLNNLASSNKITNKSLGKETFTKEIKPFLNQLSISTNDKLHTLGHHIAEKIAENVIPKSSLLITGGGAYNDFWIALIKEKTKAKITIPSKEIIEFKEALIFAFLGALRLNKTENCLASVTGAKKDTIGGGIYIY